MATPKRTAGRWAVIYCRYSNHKKGDTATLEDQERACRRIPAVVACGANVHVIREPRLSGRREDRPGLDELAGWLERPELAVVAVRESSRLARSAEISARFRRAIRARGDVELWSALAGQTTFTAAGVFMENVKSAVDEWYAAEIAEKMEASYQRKREDGLWTGPSAPFGYRSTGGGMIEPDEVTAPVVRRVFTLAADGMPLVDVARTLNAENAPYPRQRKGAENGWAAHTVKRILTARVYVAQREEVDGDYPVAWQPIVSASQWEAVRARLNGPRPRAAVRTGDNFPWRGVAKCSCGQALYWRNRGSEGAAFCASVKWPERTCTAPATAAKGEVLSAWLDSRVSAWEALDVNGETLFARRANDPSKVAALEDKLRRALNRIERIRDERDDGVISREEARAQTRAAVADRDSLMAQIEAAKDDEPSREEVSGIVGRWRAGERADVVRALFESVTVADGKVTEWIPRKDRAGAVMLLMQAAAIAETSTKPLRVPQLATL